MTNTYAVTIDGKSYVAFPNFNGQRWQIRGFETMERSSILLYEADAREDVIEWLRRKSCEINA